MIAMQNLTIVALSRNDKPRRRQGMYTVTQVLALEHGGRHPWNNRLVYRQVGRGTLMTTPQVIKHVRRSYAGTLCTGRGPTWVTRYY